MRYATDFHAPVLCEEVLEHLITDFSGTYVDATLGGGGHTAALLERLGPEGRVVGVDQDDEALQEARRRLSEALEAGRFRAIHGNFGELKHLLNRNEVGPVDGLLLDLGVSSHQIDTAERGFSYRRAGRLDMRMNTRSGITAAQVINDWSEQELRRVFYEYGEESRAPQVARAILAARPLETTEELAEVIRQAVPTREEVSVLSRIFQAVRIAVNGELEALERVLQDAPHLLKPGGRMAVISYHSLEDRRVKRVFRHGNLEGKPLRDLYGNPVTPWNELVRKPLQAGADEVEVNPRARSARLRVAERKEELPDPDKGWV